MLVVPVMVLVHIVVAVYSAMLCHVESLLKDFGKLKYIFLNFYLI